MKKKNKFRIIGSIISVGLLSTFIATFLKNYNNINDSFANNNPIQTTNTISTFSSKTNATTINTNGFIQYFNNNFNKNQYVYNVDKDQIKKMLYEFVDNKAPGFRWDHIQFDKNSPSQGWVVNGTTGEIDIYVILVKYIDGQGNVVTTNFPPVKITIGNFYPAPGPTTIASSFNVNNPNILPQSIFLDSAQLRQILDDNHLVQNVPITTDYSISNFRFSNEQGKILFDISVPVHFANQNGNYVFVEQPYILRDFELYGLKNISPTTISSEITIVNSTNILPSEFTNDYAKIRETIYNNLSNKPQSMLESDILIDNVVASNLDGNITVSYSCTNIYDYEKVTQTINPSGEDVVLVKNYKKRNDIILKGFKSVRPTVFPLTIDNIPNSSNVLAQSFSDSDIKNVLLNSIVATNNINIAAANIKLPNKTINNVEGIIKVSPSLDKFVYPNGNVYDIPGEFILFPEVTLKGFKKIKPTIIIDNPNFVGDPNVVASDATIDSIKTIISNNIDNKPDGFNNDNIIINQYQYNNRTGIITLSFTLNLYYSDVGILINTPSWPVKYISIKGFKQIEQTNIKKQVTIPNVLDKNPTDYTDDELKNYIKQNIDSIASPLPISFDPNNNLFIEQINKYNAGGYIDAFVKINCFYDSRGVVTTNDVIYTTVRFIGFNSVTPTSIESAVYLTNVANVSSADVDETMLKDLLFDDTNPTNPTSLLINNFPPSGIFSKNNIFIKITDRISTNNESYIVIDVSLNTYYNQEGLLIKNSSYALEKNNVKIYGFKQIAPTEIVTSYRIEPSSMYSNVYPSDLTIWSSESLNNLSIENLIIDNLSSFFSSYPSNIEIQNITIRSISNDTGVLLIDIQVLNYYDAYGKTETTTPLLGQINITGFKNVGPTTIIKSYSLENVEQVLSTTYTANKLLDIIWKNKDIVFTNLPSDFEKSDIEIILNNDSYDNFKGQINVEIRLKNYFDEFGTKQELIPLVSNIIFTGFKNILPTKIVSNISISLPGISKVLPSDFSDKQLLDFLYDSRNNIFINLPDEFDKNSIVLDKNKIIRNNLTGRITIQPLYISTYYDNTGKLNVDSAELYSSPIEISGFGSINYITSIANSVNISDTTYNNFLPSSVNIEILKSIIIEKSVVSYPTQNFSILDIMSDEGDILSKNNLDGTVTANIKIRNYYNENGVIDTSLDNLLSTTVTFSGFKRSKTTVAKDISINTLSSTVASNVTNSELLEIVRDNYVDIFDAICLPDSFSLLNITHATIPSYDNINGEMNVAITLNCFYDQNGALVNNGLTKTINFKISGFKKIKPTTQITTEFNANSSNKLASNVSINEVIQLLSNNINYIFDSLPDEFTQNNIEISSLTPNNLSGQIIVNGSLNFYINELGEFINSNLNPNENSYDFTLTLIGYSHVSQTIIKDTYNITGQLATLLPSQVTADNILRLVVNEPSNFIENPYITGNSIANDIIISNLRPNNLNGQLTFTLSLSKYYDNKGILVTNGLLLSSDVTIVGFLNQSETIFYTNVDLNKSDVLSIPQLVQSNQLIDIIFDDKNLFFKYLPINFAKSNIKVEKIDSYNNLEGTLSAYLRITNFVDDKGILQTSKSHRYKVNISGFKKILPTDINTDVLINNFPSSTNYASYFFNSLSELEDLIILNKRNIFVNMPPYFEDMNAFKNVLNIYPIVFNNAEGYIDVTLEIDEYYDQNGYFIQNQSVFSKTIRLTGFSRSNPTKLIDDSIIVQNADNYGLPSTITKDEITTILSKEYSSFLNPLPPNFSSYNILNIEKVSYNDVTGSVVVKFSLNHYYNELGSEILPSSGQYFTSEITINGFKKQSPSIFIDKNGNEVALGTFNKQEIVDGLTNVLPSQIDYYYTNQNADANLSLKEQKDKINNWLYEVVVKRIRNVQNTSVDNINVHFREKIFSDIDGYIEATVQISSYMSSIIGSQTNIPTEFILKITGFKKKTTSVEVQNNTLVTIVSILSVTAVICVISLLIFVFRFRIWRKSIG